MDGSKKASFGGFKHVLDRISRIEGVLQDQDLDLKAIEREVQALRALLTQGARP